MRTSDATLRYRIPSHRPALAAAIAELRLALTALTTRPNIGAVWARCQTRPNGPIARPDRCVINISGRWWRRRRLHLIWAALSASKPARGIRGLNSSDKTTATWPSKGRREDDFMSCCREESARRPAPGERHVQIKVQNPCRNSPPALELRNKRHLVAAQKVRQWCRDRRRRHRRCPGRRTRPAAVALEQSQGESVRVPYLIHLGSNKTCSLSKSPALVRPAPAASKETHRTSASPGSLAQLEQRGRLVELAIRRPKSRMALFPLFGLAASQRPLACKQRAYTGRRSPFRKRPPRLSFARNVATSATSARKS